MARDFNTPPLPLEALTLLPRHHRAALWWLGWLYRNPSAFREELRRFSYTLAIRCSCFLLVHSLPWVILLSILGHGVIMETIHGMNIKKIDRMTQANPFVSVRPPSVPIPGTGGSLLMGPSGWEDVDRWTTFSKTKWDHSKTP